MRVHEACLTAQEQKEREGKKLERGKEKERERKGRARLTNASRTSSNAKARSLFLPHCSLSFFLRPCERALSVPRRRGNARVLSRVRGRERTSVETRSVAPPLPFRLVFSFFALSLRRATDECLGGNRKKKRNRKTKRLTLSEKRRQPAPIVRN